MTAGGLQDRIEGVQTSRLAIVTDIITPYRVAEFNAIGKVLGTRLRVFFMGRRSASRRWGDPYKSASFSYEVLRGANLQVFRHRGDSFHVNWRVQGSLARFSPDVVVIGGYNHPTSFAVARYTKNTGAKLILWCESTLPDVRRRWRLIESMKRKYLDWCDGFVVPGTASTEYLASYGIPPEKIVCAPNAVDNEFYIRESVSLVESGMRDELRRQAGLPAYVVLFVGRLSPEKNFPLVVEAVAQLEGGGASIGLLVVGDGPWRQQYEALVRSRGLKKAIFVGFVHAEKMPHYYCQADVLMLPSSSEPWGFVVNEAMACGLPVLCSARTGASRDLVQNGVTGYICSDLDEYVKRLKELEENCATRELFRRSCRDAIGRFSPEECAAGFAEVLDRWRRA